MQPTDLPLAVDSRALANDTMLYHCIRCYILYTIRRRYLFAKLFEFTFARRANIWMRFSVFRPSHNSLFQAAHAWWLDSSIRPQLTVLVQHVCAKTTVVDGCGALQTFQHLLAPALDKASGVASRAHNFALSSANGAVRAVRERDDADAALLQGLVGWRNGCMRIARACTIFT